MQKSTPILAFLFIACLTVNLVLRGPFLLCDCLAPLLGLTVVIQWRQTLKSLKEDWLLGVFLVLASVATICHLIAGTGNIYDMAIFGYMAVIYLFFKQTALPEKDRIAVGLYLLFILAISYYASLAFGIDYLFYQDIGINLHTSSMLARRYMFLFRNPNLLGPFYALVFALLSPWIAKNSDRLKTFWQFALAALVLLLCLLPLLSTASKHALMTGAILAGSLVQTKLFARWWLKTAMFTVLVLFALVSLTTVIVQTFPLKQDFPYISTDVMSNYAVHHRIYAKILTSDSRIMLRGEGQQRLHELYPRFAGRDSIANVLKHYHAEQFLDVYSTFMDPHNEYLNLCCFFGIPAALVLIAFLILLAFRGRRAGATGLPLMLFIPALLFCCYWDDILSKRFIWVILALLVAQLYTTSQHNSIQEPEP